MRILPTEFAGRSTQKGFLFTQLIRDKHKALYKKEDEYGNIYYEPIIIRTRGTAMIGDYEIFAGEIYPNDSEFGVYARCFTDYDKALKYYHEIDYSPKEYLTEEE